MIVALDANTAAHTADLIASLRAENAELRAMLAEVRHEVNQARAQLAMRREA